MIGGAFYGNSFAVARPDERQWGARLKPITDFNGDGRVDLLVGDRSSPKGHAPGR